MIPAHVRLFVGTEPVDLRRAVDGLALAARERLGEDPRAGGLFVFTNRRANRCKVVWCDRTGACLLSRRLHDARFRLPAADDAPGVRIDGVPSPPRAPRTPCMYASCLDAVQPVGSTAPPWRRRQRRRRGRSRNSRRKSPGSRRRSRG